MSGGWFPVVIPYVMGGLFALVGLAGLLQAVVYLKDFWGVATDQYAKAPGRTAKVWYSGGRRAADMSFTEFQRRSAFSTTVSASVALIIGVAILLFPK